LLRIRVAGRRQLIGLGSYPELSLAKAREEARELKANARNGVDLVARKRANRSALIAASSKQKTFQECALTYMTAHASDYTNEKHKYQWTSTVKTYAFPIIGRMLVSDISMRHILDVVLQPTTDRDGKTGQFWHTKPETAKRLLDRIRVVLNYATVKESGGEMVAPPPTATTASMPPQAPSQLLPGLIEGASLRRPQARPPK
jgi:hypothetical protein